MLALGQGAAAVGQVHVVGAPLDRLLQRSDLLVGPVERERVTAGCVVAAGEEFTAFVLQVVAGLSAVGVVAPFFPSAGDLESVVGSGILDIGDEFGVVGGVTVCVFGPPGG